MVAIMKCLLVLTAALAAHGFELGPIDIVFHIFTRVNPTLSQPLLPTLSSIMSATTFSLSRKTVFAIHSEADSVGGNFIAFMVPSHLQAEDVNLIAVDWSAGAGMYTQGLGNAPQVGQVIADFINILSREFGYGASNIRIVGVGLGGHIAGIAARAADQDIPHIIAIDPSFHGWTHHPDRLNRDDAGVVEVLHATATSYGYDYPLGDVDFYPNGGSFMNGCGIDTACSHTYSYIYYAESITRDINGGDRFIGTACESYEQAVAQQCAGARDLHFGGTEVKSDVSGIYWFQTNTFPPFAQG